MIKIGKVIVNVVIPIIFVSLIFLNLPTACGHEHSHSHEHSDMHDGEAEAPSFKWSQQANVLPNEEMVVDKDTNNHEINGDLISSKWIEALGATLLISIAPYLILFFVPVTNKKEHEPYLKILLAFASGGLLGDAFLHLIPHALMSYSGENNHSHSHSHGEGGGGHAHDNTVGVSVLCGIITFLVVEKFVRIFNDGHGHSHSKQNGTSDVTKSDNKKTNGDETAKDSTEKNMKVSGYLNLAADFAHNLTDGLAIGASFLAGRNIGIVTTFTIFLHEVPHEIGDFAILLQSGCSRKKAMMLQLVTALGAILGVLISLAAGGAGAESASWILPFTAGGFIYIATVSVIPELLENSSLWQSVTEVLAILLGVSLMIGITWLEEISN